MRYMARLWKWMGKQPRDFALQGKIKHIMKRHLCSYYFLLTFSGEAEARAFWDHISALREPPELCVLLWGSWLSTDYNDQRYWFVAWLTRGRAESSAIGRWEHERRGPSVPVGVSYGSPASPLAVPMRVERVLGGLVLIAASASSPKPKPPARDVSFGGPGFFGVDDH